MGNQYSGKFNALRRRETKTTPKTGREKVSGFGKKIIRVFVEDGREYQLHATKGWRSRRA